MKIKKSYLRKIILERTILEGVVDRLLAQYPQLQPAIEAGINNKVFLLWMTKQNEPVEDIIGLVKSFEKNKNRLAEKDINRYTSDELRQALEDLSPSRREAKEGSYEKLEGDFGEWKVYMPKTQEGSCLLGKDTTWCTAATQSENLFLSYVAMNKENVVLYYIIKENGNPRINPTDKLSVGFIEGEPQLTGNDGGLSVDAKNKGLNETRLSQILGVYYDPIMNAMEEHAELIGGKHPARKQIEMIASYKDLSMIDKYTQGMDEDNKFEFIMELLRNHKVSYPILEKLSEHEDRYIRKAVAENNNVPTEILEKLSNDNHEFVRGHVAINMDTPLEILKKLAEDDSAYVRGMMARYERMPLEILEKLAEDDSDSVRLGLAWNEAMPVEIIIKLSEDEDEDVRGAIATLRTTPVEILRKLSDDNSSYVRASMARSHPVLPIEILEKLSNDKNGTVRAAVAGNIRTPPEILRKLSEDRSWVVYDNAIRNPNYDGPRPHLNEKYTKIKKSHLRKIILESLILEGKKQEGWIENKINQDIEFKNFYDALEEEDINFLKNISINELSWIANPKKRDGETYEETFNVLKAFLQDPRIRQRMKSKRISTDLNQYNTNTLRQIMEEVSGPSISSRKIIESINNPEYCNNLGKFGKYYVVRPLNEKGSIEIAAKKTQWCTASTKSLNYFNKYMVENKKVLYYIVNPEGNTRSNPFEYMSIGFDEGVIALPSRKGGLSVNAEQAGLNNEILKRELKDQYENIINAIKSHAASTDYKIPLRTLYEELEDSNISSQRIEEIFNITQNKSIRKKIFSVPNISPEFFEKVRKNINPNEINSLLMKISEIKNLNKAMINYISKQLYNESTQMDNSYKFNILQNIAKNPNTPLRILIDISNLSNFKKSDKFTSIKIKLLSSLAENTSITKNIIEKLFEIEESLGDENKNFILRSLSKNHSIESIYLEKIYNNAKSSYDYFTYINLAENPNTPEHILEELFLLDMTPVNISLANNKSASQELLRKLSKIKDLSVLNRLADNPNIPDDVFESLFSIGGTFIHLSLSTNPNTPLGILKSILEVYEEKKGYSIDTIKPRILNHPTYKKYLESQNSINENQMKIKKSYLRKIILERLY